MRLLRSISFASIAGFALCAAAQQNPKLPEAPVPEAGDSIYAPIAIKGEPDTTKIKLENYVVRTFGPRAIVSPAFSAAIRMARPPKYYPREWRDGAEAFGRNYGEAFLTKVAGETARTGFSIVLHEDVRYRRSATATGFGRFWHAVGYTFVDSNDAGHRTIAVSNFAGAAAGGFVGLAVLPDAYNNYGNGAVHFASRLGGFAFSNVAREYSPEISRFFGGHHLPFPHLPIPEWYSNNLEVVRTAKRRKGTQPVKDPVTPPAAPAAPAPAPATPQP